jgi:hypothetical protein
MVKFRLGKHVLSFRNAALAMIVARAQKRQNQMCFLVQRQEDSRFSSFAKKQLSAKTGKVGLVF